METVSASTHVLVIGASLGGIHVAQTLRREGFSGPLTVIGEETHLPYDRPPLSKRFLAGSWEESKLTLRAATQVDELSIDMRRGVRAMSLDLDNNCVVTQDGEAIGFDIAVIATGAAPRRLPFESDNVLYLRTLDDAKRLRERLTSSVGTGDDDSPANGRSVAIVGAGFIGAEVASTARDLGADVVVIEAAAYPLSRVLDHDHGMAIAELHRSHGVDVRLNTGVDGIEDEGDGVVLRLSDGSSIDADVVVVGIGCQPATQWLEGSGLELDDGVVCDRFCAAADNVYAVGDVARWPNERYGDGLMRIEQWDNAIEQAGYVAKRIMGKLEAPYTPVPSFWSDQYDRKIQLVGVPTANARVVHGAIEDGVFVTLFTNDDGEPVGVLGWNRPRHTTLARMELQNGTTLDQILEKIT